MAEVSVIVPVYNGERYLGECLESVLHQDAHDWELIAVNDGSTDHTGEILRQYASRDARIHVIEKPNTGQMDSIRQAILQANGTYLMFLDADDTYKEKMISTLLQAIQSSNADCVRGGYVKKQGSQERIELIVPQGMYDQAAIHEKILVPFFEKDANLYRLWSAARWDKIYRTDLVRRVYETYEMNLSIGEDALFALCCLQECRLAVSLPDAYLYEYRVLDGSLSRGFSNALYQKYQGYIDRMHRFCRENGYQGGAMPILEDTCTLNMIYELKHTDSLSRADKAMWNRTLKKQLHDRRLLYKLLLKEDFPFKQQLLKLRSRLK